MTGELFIKMRQQELAQMSQQDWAEIHHRKDLEKWQQQEAERTRNSVARSGEREHHNHRIDFWNYNKAS